MADQLPLVILLYEGKLEPAIQICLILMEQRGAFMAYQTMIVKEESTCMIWEEM